MLISTPGLAPADPGSPDSIAALIAAVADANQKLQDLGAAVQSQQESVNKALVDVQSARDAAAAAQQQVDVSQRGVTDANAAIAAAQQALRRLRRRDLRQRPVGFVPGRGRSRRHHRTAAAGETLAVSAQQVISRPAAGPHRTGEQRVRRAAGQAERRPGRRRCAIQSGRRGRSTDHRAAELRCAAGRAGPVDRRAQGRAGQARRRPQLVRTGGRAATRGAGRRLPPATARDLGSRARPPRRRPHDSWATPWDPTLPAIPSAFVSGDPIAIINAVLGIAATSAQVTADLGRNFLKSIGILKPADTGINNGAHPAGVRSPGLRVRDPPRHVAAGRALLLGRR